MNLYGVDHFSLFLIFHMSESFLGFTLTGLTAVNQVTLQQMHESNATLKLKFCVCFVLLLTSVQV